MKIYTRTGDDGSTGLLGGDRTLKSSLRIQAIGDVDELNSAVGVARAASVPSELDPLFSQIQSSLFDVGAELASSPDSRIKIAAISNLEIEELENSIDFQTAALPPLTFFILPAGSDFAARLHYARSVCRRAERSVLQLHAIEPIRSDVLSYLNRLSDWLFVAARTANATLGVADVAWQKSKGN